MEKSKGNNAVLVEVVKVVEGELTAKFENRETFKKFPNRLIKVRAAGREIELYEVVLNENPFAVDPSNPLNSNSPALMLEMYKDKGIFKSCVMNVGKWTGLEKHYQPVTYLFNSDEKEFSNHNFENFLMESGILDQFIKDHFPTKYKDNNMETRVEYMRYSNNNRPIMDIEEEFLIDDYGHIIFTNGDYTTFTSRVRTLESFKVLENYAQYVPEFISKLSWSNIRDIYKMEARAYKDRFYRGAILSTIFKNDVPTILAFLELKIGNVAMVYNYDEIDEDFKNNIKCANIYKIIDTEDDIRYIIINDFKNTSWRLKNVIDEWFDDRTITKSVVNNKEETEVFFNSKDKIVSLDVETSEENTFLYEDDQIDLVKLVKAEIVSQGINDRPSIKAAISIKGKMYFNVPLPLKYIGDKKWKIDFKGAEFNFS